MAQTTTARSFRNAIIQYQTGATWEDMSGVANALTVSGGDRITGEAHTADSDLPILLFGKLNSLDVDIRIVYSDNSTEAFMRLEPLYKNGTNLRIRWTPNGFHTGALLFVTDTINITKFQYPGGEVGDGAPILLELGVKTGKMTYAAMSSTNPDP